MKLDTLGILEFYSGPTALPRYGTRKWNILESLVSKLEGNNNNFTSFCVRSSSCRTDQF